MIKRQEVAAYEYGNILREEFELHPEWSGSQGR